MGSTGWPGCLRMDRQLGRPSTLQLWNPRRILTESHDTLEAENCSCCPCTLSNTEELFSKHGLYTVIYWRESSDKQCSLFSSFVSVAPQSSTQNRGERVRRAESKKRTESSPSCRSPRQCRSKPFVVRSSENTWWKTAAQWSQQKPSELR